MLSGSLLDNGGRGVTQALVGVGCVVGPLLLIALLVPVVVVMSVLHPLVGVPLGGPVDAVTQAATNAVVSVVGAPLATSTANVGQPQVVEVAQRYLGVPYVFGGTNPAVGLDCSGLVQLVFRQLGMSLPRTAQQQYDATPRISRDQLQPGDLVFFARTYADPHDWVTHVGIYIGNGQQINAPTEGQRVSVQPVFTGFFGDHFVGGGRVAR